MIYLGVLSAMFHETLYPEWAQNFEMEKVIVEEKTEQQDLVIFENKRFGRVLALDGAIQLTEADEPIYHEMIAHVPLLTHPNPRSVLIVGGGDGGTLREVLRHPTIEKVVLVEIDASVIDTSKRYFPKLSNGAFDDPRVEVRIEDGAKYVAATDERFDVIISDSSDRMGPAEALFTTEYYGNCKSKLKEGGIFVNHYGVPFTQKGEVKLGLNNLSPHFQEVGFFVATIPTYVGGVMAFGFASDVNYQISEEILQERLSYLQSDFFYYTPKVHKAAFALPNYILKQLH